MTLTLSPLGGGTNELRFNTLRGLYYKVQSTTNLAEPFTDESWGAMLAFDSTLARTNTADGPQKFFRAFSALTP